VAFLIAILTLLLLGLVVLVVGAPLRRARRGEDVEPAGVGVLSEGGGQDSSSTARRDALESAREAKYREIRDAELDYRTGKLSNEDYDAIDADLRAEAIEILDRLDDVTPTEP
jgi:hypothetical protein